MRSFPRNLLCKPLFVAAVGALLAVGLALAASQSKASDDTHSGFSAQRWSWEQDYEAKLKAGIDPQRAREDLLYLTDKPHVAGTPGNLRVAQYIYDRFREYGLEAEMVDYDVLLAYPEKIQVEIVAPERVELAHPEPVDPADPHTDLHGDPIVTPPWNAYAANADLTAPVIYANYGRPEDLAQLEEVGIDLKGKILLERYFNGYRGGKSFEAEKHGVAGVLVYSDPMEDGYFQGDVWPKGPWGPPGHFQRGATVYDFLVPGDPLTPGWASTPDAKRIAPEESRILPHIPMVPLSAPDAEQILRRLAGLAVFKGWQGALPFTYHIGAGEVRVHLVNQQRRVRTTIHDVIGRIPGTDFPDQLVLLGNHHDAWVYGAVDPASGTASMLELARVLGGLAKQGIRPRRTLVFGNWDAEEYTLTGSTEWGEQFADKLRGKTIACLNVDSSVSGQDFSIGAAPLLRRVVIEATKAVEDPATGKSVYDHWTQSETGASLRLYVAGGAQSGPRIERLGSGSDYTVFFNHLGIPSLDMIFDGPYGVYHSAYDSFMWMERYADPHFLYHAAMSRLWGVMALRLANADVVPLDPGAYASELKTYVEEMRTQASPEFYIQHLEPIQQEVHRLAQAAQKAEERWDGWLEQPGAHTEQLARANASLLQLEDDFTRPEGIPGRPWFKHLVYAPLPSYRPEVLPGIQEALKRGDIATAAEQARWVEEAVRAARLRLEQIR